MTKPRIISPCVAERYNTDRAQRIAEISTKIGGALLSVRERDEHVEIEIYRADPSVRVVTPPDPLRDAAADMLAALKDAVQVVPVAGRLHSQDLVALQTRLLAAIAKAEGRA